LVMKGSASAKEGWTKWWRGAQARKRGE
jgi:hypothetical protein